jgi:CheY-like chemotaxis protein
MGRDPHSDTCILVVDDEPDIREMVAEVLSDEGYRVVGAANGLEAIEYLTRATTLPTLILLDLMMPVMNGWEFADRQRLDPALADIPVIVISADGNVQQKAETLGASDHLRKPIQLDALLKCVERYA